MKSNRILVACAMICLAFVAQRVFAEDKPAEVKTADKPAIKALLVCGGCCHDYDRQKFILTKGISKMANVEWTIVREGGASSDHKVSIYEKPEWWKGYDVIVHDECFAAVTDVAFIDGILAAHKAGVPAVNLHCAMHCYRFGDYQKPVAAGADNSHWYEYLGLQSTGHGSQEPIAISFVDKEHAITKGLADWTTIKEELYNNIQILTGKPLARGKQTLTNKDGTKKEVETVVAWTNEYGPKKTRVFSTTIGHNNETVGDDRYLTLVTRGLLWSVDKLNDDYLKAAKQVYTDPATDTESNKGPQPTPAKKP